MDVSAQSMTIVKVLQIVAFPESANVAILGELAMLMWQDMPLLPLA